MVEIKGNILFENNVLGKPPARVIKFKYIITRHLLLLLLL